MTFTKQSIKYLLFAIALTPLVFVNYFPFPHVFSKIFFFRVLVEILLVLFLIYLSWLRDIEVWRRLKSFFGNRLTIALLLFFTSAFLSTLFAESQFRAFWGDAARGDGFFNLLHFLIFLIISVSIFDRKDWMAFFKISVLIGAAAVFFSWPQFLAVYGYVNLDNLPFGIRTGPGSGGSALGNPAFLGTYLLFLIGFSLLIFLDTRESPVHPPNLSDGKLGGVSTDVGHISADKGGSGAPTVAGEEGSATVNNKRSRFWSYFSGGVAVASVPTIFLTNVRGAILGLLAGVLFFLLYFSFLKTWINPPKFFEEKLGRVNTDEKRIYTDTAKLKRRSRRALVGLLALGLIFIATRGAVIWQSVPGFSRLAAISLKDSSFQTRLIALGVSWEAFREHPVLGWGPENYITAYNKHYNPAYAVYEEAFFDRAHNKLAEILVIQGLVGFLSYLAVFFFLFYVLFRKVVSSWIKAILGAAIAAYFFQNLLLFDTPVTYLMLFALLGYLTSETLVTSDEKTLMTAHRESVKINYKSAPIGALTILVAGGVVYSLYSFHLVPFKQVKAFRIAEREQMSVAELLERAPAFLEPYNFIQPTIRFQFLQSVVNTPEVRVPEFGPVADLAAKAMIEVVRREPRYDLRNHTLLGEIYNERGRANRQVLPLGEKYLRQALELGPKRQDTYYLLAFNLAAQGRFQEAIETNKQAVTLNENVAKSHYNLGISYVLAGREYFDLSERSLDRAFEIGFLDPSSLATDFNNILTAYRGIISAYILERNQEATLRVARKIIGVSRELNPALAQDMELIIDYASREDWDALIEAVRANSSNN